MQIYKKGFTLVELLVVMAIIMILAGIAIPALNNARNKAKNMEVSAGCNTIMGALERFAVDHGGMYPGAHWEEDLNGNLYVGAGVLGGVPAYDAAGLPRKNFQTLKPYSLSSPPAVVQTAGSQNLDYYANNGNTADATPDPRVIDSIIAEGYLTDYPANPFLAATGGVKSQMSNLFEFRPMVGTQNPAPYWQDFIDWNIYTNPSTEYASTRTSYVDFGRGHFSYIPLNPVNNTGEDYTANWLTYDTGNAGDRALLKQYYNRCRGYILVGWGHSRQEDTMSKGLSEKYWNSSLGGFDFDNSLSMDKLEGILSIPDNTGPLYSEMLDSDLNAGAFGQVLPGGALDIGPAFAGAVFLKITGS